MSAAYRRRLSLLATGAIAYGDCLIAEADQIAADDTLRRGLLRFRLQILAGQLMTYLLRVNDVEDLLPAIERIGAACEELGEARVVHLRRMNVAYEMLMEPPSTGTPEKCL